MRQHNLRVERGRSTQRNFRDNPVNLLNLTKSRFRQNPRYAKYRAKPAKCRVFHANGRKNFFKKQVALFLSCQKRKKQV
jgi:hypothetical protein